MRIDPDDLRKQYRALSDEALLAIERSDLTEVAQRVYDAELRLRGLTPRGFENEFVDEAPVSGTGPEEEAPGWAKKGFEVFLEYQPAGADAALKAEQVRNTLEAAGIPCYLEYAPARDEEGPPLIYWRVVVPPTFSLQANDTLDRDIFNQEFEDEWRTHLETLSESELREMTPENCFCGLFDRVERVNRAYAEELARRGLS